MVQFSDRSAFLFRAFELEPMYIMIHIMKILLETLPTQNQTYPLNVGWRRKGSLFLSRILNCRLHDLLRYPIRRQDHFPTHLKLLSLIHAIEVDGFGIKIFVVFLTI